MVPCDYSLEVGDNHGYEHRLQRVAVDEDLLDVRTLPEDAFEFLRSNILALSKLKDILGSVDNFDAPVRQDHPYVAGP